MKRRNLVIIIISAIFLVIAVAFLITGFAFAGYDILGWFGSKWAMWFYVILGVYGLTILFIFLGDRIRRI